MSGRRILKSGRRRARKRGCPIEDFTGADLMAWWELVDIDHRVCYWCGGAHESADHVMPIAMYGAHSYENIVPCCHTCNNDKDSMHPLAWIAMLVSDEYWENRAERAVRRAMELEAEGCMSLDQRLMGKQKEFYAELAYLVPV